MSEGLAGPKEKPPKLGVRVGLYNDRFTMTEKVLSKTRFCNVRGRQAEFDITAGPLVFPGLEKPLVATYLLEIGYEDSQGDHSSELLGGWGAELIADYAEVVNELALKLCAEEKWVLNSHLNSWPRFQAVVSEDPNLGKEQAVDADSKRSDIGGIAVRLVEQ